MNPQRDNIIAAGVGGLPPSTPAIRWASAEAQRREAGLRRAGLHGVGGLRRA